VVMGAAYDRVAAIRPGDNCAQALRGVVVDARGYDWEGDRPLLRPYGETLIYELHVGGFTRSESAGLPPALRGTYAGLIAKIPYLQDLGVTAVELLPVQHFDPLDAPPGRINYWGYSPLAFFAPHGPYSSRRDPLGPVDEFRDMVKALHKAGIEVILDVVFNHTAEGDERGPTLSFKGLDNGAYYIAGETPARYANFTGCGNTINANHSVMRHLILDCLRYWTAEMHVDGFRFDLASVLSRDGKGKPRENAPILWSIDSDPVLAGSKLIAEAWDAAGLYQVGSFTGERFAEWNGPFRDDLRRFLRGDAGFAKAVALRMAGSPDLYANPALEANRSINFVTCHDGFTLADLVSYAQKHNEANGEGNRDGTNENYSANCGVEGASTDPQLLALRARQQRNFLALLLCAQGTPMLSMGDELDRSQQGNNNAYCQDNALAWLDWSALTGQAPLHAFVRELAAYARSLAVFRDERFWREDGAGGTLIQWHGVRLGQPDWSPSSRSLAFTLSREREGERLHLCLNAWREPLDFALPPPGPGAAWHRVLDTSLPPGEDLRLPPAAPALPGGAYRVADRSVVLLQALPLF
ncbi:glycogen debranching enzyme, partial [bacterium]|nr:glycogen debranching enzyme [bacterium]